MRGISDDIEVGRVTIAFEWTKPNEQRTPESLIVQSHGIGQPTQISKGNRQNQQQAGLYRVHQYFISYAGSEESMNLSRRTSPPDD